MDEWQEHRFADLLKEPVRNGIYKPKQFHGTGHKIVNMGELFAWPRLKSVPMKRVKLSEAESARFCLASGDLIFARRSLTAEGAGKCSIVLETNEPTTFESSIIRARPDPEKASPLFLYYFFNSPAGRYALGTIRRQVAVAGITGSDLSNLLIRIPGAQVQNEIAAALSGLDEMIELNQGMNGTLEETARAIFRDWFIDFGPTRAKLEERDTYLAADIWALFPGALDEEGLPHGWRRGRLHEIADAPSRTVSPYVVEPSTPYIALEHMPRRSVALGEWAQAEKATTNKSRFKAGEFLFGKLRPYFHKVGVAPVEGICSTDIVVVAPKEPHWSAILLAYISSDDFVEHSNLSSTGTKMPRTSWPIMRNYELALPPVEVAEAFEALCGSVIRRIVANVLENRTLSELRDLLLPKLMSGEIGVAALREEGAS